MLETSLSANSPYVHDLNPSSGQIEASLGFKVLSCKDGKRILKFSIGDMDVKAVEVPADVISKTDWSRIQKARESYHKMWGGNGYHRVVEEDPFDGRSSEHLPFQTHHYIASIERLGEQTKYLTLRRVSFNYDRAIDATGIPVDKGAVFPDDIAFWQVSNTITGQVMPFWNLLRDYSNINGLVVPYPTSQRLRVASLSRTGTYPYDVEERTEIQREKSGIAFAAMEILATDCRENDFLVSQLCSEFREGVLSLKTVEGNLVTPAFYPTTETLNLPPHIILKLNNEHRGVYEHKAHFPGYWLDNNGAGRVFSELIEDGRLLAKDLVPTLREIFRDCTGRDRIRLLKDLAKIGLDGLPAKDLDNFYWDVEGCKKIVLLLTRSRYSKYLVPMLNTSGQITDRLSGEELRSLLVYTAGDGPYSSTYTPSGLRKNAFDLLIAAKEKYG